jgi:tetratricopeptide (TPR) repeat protein
MRQLLPLSFLLLSAPLLSAAPTRMVSGDPWAGIWYPTGVQWSTPLADYRVLIEKAFAAEPGLKPRVCAWAREVRIQDGDRNPDLRKHLLQTCRSESIPVEARFEAIDTVAGVSMKAPATLTDAEAQRKWIAADWLAWRFRREMEVISTLSPESRRKHFDSLQPSMLSGNYMSFTRFGHGIRLFLLRPDDDRGAYHFAKWVSKSKGSTPAIMPEETVEFIGARVSELASTGDADWMRAARNVRMYFGDFAGARKFATDLVASGAVVGRDRIMLAVIEEAEGKVGSVAKLQNNCPPADLLYQETNAPTALRGEFCRYVAMEVAARLLEIQGNATPASIHRLATLGPTAGPSRDAAPPLKIHAGVLGASEAPPVKKQTAPGQMVEEERKLLAAIAEGEASARNKSAETVMEEAFNVIMHDRLLNVEAMMKMAGVYPESTYFVYSALHAMPRAISSSGERRLLLRRVLNAKAEQGGPAAIHWLRNVAAFDLYSGDFESAIKGFQAVERLEGKDRTSITPAALAVLERVVHGNDKRYRAYFANCPDPPNWYLRHRYDRTRDAAAFCRDHVYDVLWRTGSVLGAELPVPMRDLMELYTTIEPWPSLRINMASELIASDPERAIRILGKVISDAQGDDHVGTRVVAYQKIASAKAQLRKDLEAYAALDKALENLGYQPKMMTVEGWVALVKFSNGPVGSESRAMRVLRQRFYIARQIEDVPGARKAIEALSVAALESHTGLRSVEFELFQLATLLVKLGRASEARRIIGYAGHAVTAANRSITGGLGELIRAEGGLEKIPVEATPWDAPAKAPRATTSGAASRG